MKTEEENIIEQIPAKKPTYDELMQQYEQIPAFDYNAFRNQYDSGKKPLFDALMSSYTKPVAQLTPEQAQRARNAAAISDAFSSLAEIFAHSQGANIRNRGGQSSQRTTNDRLRQIQDRYEQDLLRYNTMRNNAIMQDFQHQLRSAMAEREEKRKNILLRAERARQLESEASKLAAAEAKNQRARQDKLDAEERKYQRDKELIRERARYRLRDYGGNGGVGTSHKNVFEIPVPENTQGAMYDEYTGKSYIRQQISPERQLTILSNLPGGKQQYVINNRLYKTYNFKDEYGNIREQVVPFTDAEIIKFYLENNYVRNRSQRQPSQRTPAVAPSSSATNRETSYQSIQPRFNHSPY